MPDTNHTLATDPAATSTNSPPAGPPEPDRRRRSLIGHLGAPFRYARRRPYRFLARLAGTAVLVAVIAAAGVFLWFRHHLSAARTAVDRGHNAEASRHLRHCQRVYAQHPQVLLMIARVARRSGEWEQAEEFLDQYWKRYGDDDGVVLERLLLRATRGELEAAGPALRARIATGGRDAGPARDALITGFLYRFRWQEATAALDEWLALEPNNTFALLLWGKLQEQRLATDEALNAYRQILELDAGHDEARLRLTTLLLQRFSGEEALPHVAVLRERLPENTEVAQQWATVMFLQGRTAEARSALAECLRDYPDHPAVLALAGRQASLDGDDAAAADYLVRAVRLGPGNLAVRYQYTQALIRLGRKDEAAVEEARIATLKEDLDRISALVAGPLQERPNDPEVHYQIAVIAIRAGQVDEGVRWLHRALQVGPNHLPSHQTLAGFYQSTGNPVLAARHRAFARNLEGRKP